VGTVPYLVGRPLDLGLGETPGIELRQELPAQLVTSLREGRLDVALVSSIELFRRPGYGYVDGLAVLGDGPVSSVQLFLRQPAETLRRVALDPASRTSATLVQILLAERFGARPEFLEVPAGLDPREVPADAWLRIGDAALRERLLEPELESLDPSLVWRQWTAFRASRSRGAAAAPELAEAAARESGLPRAALRHYLLEECRYDPGPALRPALLRFRDLAAAHGLCDGSLEPAPTR
jgi:chorismate dehydratase